MDLQDLSKLGHFDGYLDIKMTKEGKNARVVSYIREYPSLMTNVALHRWVQSKWVMNCRVWRLDISAFLDSMRDTKTSQNSTVSLHKTKLFFSHLVLSTSGHGHKVAVHSNDIILDLNWDMLRYMLFLSWVLYIIIDWYYVMLYY